MNIKNTILTIVILFSSLFGMAMHASQGPSDATNEDPKRNNETNTQYNLDQKSLKYNNNYILARDLSGAFNRIAAPLIVGALQPIVTEWRQLTLGKTQSEKDQDELMKVTIENKKANSDLSRAQENQVKSQTLFAASREIKNDPTLAENIKKFQAIQKNQWDTLFTAEMGQTYSEWDKMHEKEFGTANKTT